MHANSPDYPFMQGHHFIQRGTRSFGAEENKSNPINVHPNRSPFRQGEGGHKSILKEKEKNCRPGRLVKARPGFWEQRWPRQFQNNNKKKTPAVTPKWFPDFLEVRRSGAGEESVVAAAAAVNTSLSLQNTQALWMWGHGCLGLMLHQA